MNKKYASLALVGVAWFLFWQLFPPIRSDAQEQSNVLRTWTSTSGTKVEAHLKSVDKQSVTLEREDGKMIVVPLDKLSEGDRKFIDSTKNPADDESHTVLRPHSILV